MYGYNLTMKKNTKLTTEQNTLTVLPLLIHTKTATFPWSRSVIEEFYLYARRNGLQLKAMYHWQDVVQWNGCPFLIVLGVDVLWLEEVLEHLKPLQLRIILLNGVLSHNHSCHISRIMYDQKTWVEDSLALLHRLGRTRPAFYGVQPNDTSDEAKSAVFSRQISPGDVYRITDSMESCFQAFWNRINCYDSVICANDIMAVYLIKRCRESGMRIPEDLYVIGNGNLRIGAHVSPSLTTAYYDMVTLVEVVVQTCQSLCTVPNISSIDIYLKTAILERESTGCSFQLTDTAVTYRDLYQYDETVRDNTSNNLFPEIQEIKTIDRSLTSCSPVELHILELLTKENTYEDISEQVILSSDAVKYHIKKLYKKFGIHTRQELKKLIQDYQIRLL